jgi:uncharacterized membrane protein YfcA
MKWCRYVVSAKRISIVHKTGMNCGISKLYINTIIMKQLFYILCIVVEFTCIYNVSASAQTHPHKRHWSHRKKDAVIGGGAGAVTGALVSRHPVKGAVVGGAVGTGAGYLVGKRKDRKYHK